MALKLSDSDKQTIVELYRHPEESTATLASRYGVSSSTISRILKQKLSASEYQDIVQQKKGGGSKPQSRRDDKTAADKPATPKPTLQGAEAAFVSQLELGESECSDPSDRDQLEQRNDGAANDDVTPVPSGSSKQPRIRKRSSAVSSRQNNVDPPSHDAAKAVLSSSEDHDVASGDEDDVQLSLADAESLSLPIQADEAESSEGDDVLVHEIEADLLDDESEFDDDLLAEEDDEILGEDEILDEDDLNDAVDDGLGIALVPEQLSVLPFSEAKLPRTCYIIIDRSAELITRPLKTFADLGTVPDEDINEQTLPIFDNHRVAKRFANRRTQRIVKVPDARILRKTSTYLMEKGITRLLLDGQVYTLMDENDCDEDID